MTENLDRVLEVATEVFAEDGFETSIEVVAQRAGVGLGTIYRRFANKDALVDELARRLLARAVEIAERHLDAPPDAGLFAYLWEIGELLASHIGIVARMWNVPGAEESVERSRAAQASLLRRAQRAGVVRRDLVAEDIAVICWSVTGVVDVTRGLGVSAWKRHLELYVNSLRVDSKPLTHKPLHAKDIDAAVARSNRRGRG